MKRIATSRRRARSRKERWETITPEFLRDTGAVLTWATRKGYEGEHDQIAVVCAASRALSVGANPSGLFRWLVENRKWEFISQADEDAGLARLRELRGRERGRKGSAASDSVSSVADALAELQSVLFIAQESLTTAAQLPR